MKSNLFLRVIIFLFLSFASVTAKAAPVTSSEAEVWAKEEGQKLLQTFGEPDIAKKYAMLDEMLIRDIDLDYVSKFVLGRYWRQLSADQQEQYQQLFHRYAMSLYKGFPLDFDSSTIDFEITKVIPTDKNTTVRAKINLQKNQSAEQQPLSDIFVDFVLHRNNEKIQIIDLKLGESSLILSYRSRFYEMIAKNDDDVTWFLEDLADITEAAERSNQEKLQQSEY